MHNKQAKSVVMVAFLANLLIAISKFAVFFITKSSSILSEAIHSVADTGNQVLLLIGMAKAEKKADSTHPFGYGKEQFFWAFMVAVFLFSIGGLYSFIEGIEKIKHSSPIENLPVAIGLLIISIILEGISFLKANREINKLKGNLNVFQYMRKSFRAELVVVFFEDFAALIGLSVALVFILLSYFTGNPVYDGAGSVLIGILLMVIAFLIGREMKSLIIGEAMPDKVKNFIVQTFKKQKGVLEIADFKSMVLGENSMLAALEIVFEKNLNTEEIRKIIDNAEKEILQTFPEVKNVYVEPRVKNDD